MYSNIATRVRRSVSENVQRQSSTRKTKRSSKSKLAELALPELISFQTILGKLVHDSTSAAAELLVLLNTYKLNIITVESVTGGLIASTLVDIPSYSACVYGGFVVYDSDAKREFIDVKIKSVYTQTCAKQMAEGALRNSRAMCAIAVSGQSGGYDDTDEIYLGNIDFGFSIRKPNGLEFHTVTKRVQLCEDKNIKESCMEYKRRLNILHTQQKCNELSPYKTPLTNDLYTIRKLIRTLCVEYACQFAIESLNDYGKENIVKAYNTIFDITERDKKLKDCGEPSKYIKQYMKGDLNVLKSDIYPIKFGKTGDAKDTHYDRFCDQHNYDEITSV